MSLHHGFSSALPVSEEADELPYLRQKLAMLSSRDAEASSSDLARDSNNTTNNSYLRQLEVVHKRSQQCLRLEQQRLEAMLKDAEKQRVRETSRAQEQARRASAAKERGPEVYCKPFCKFMTENPTVFHAVDAMAKGLSVVGTMTLSARDCAALLPSRVT